jgi:hypothetical protein
MGNNMKRLKKNIGFTAIVIFLIVFTGFIFFLPDMVIGQDLPPIFPDDPEQTPIDGGLGILAALGGAYAIKKLRNKE